MALHFDQVEALSSLLGGAEEQENERRFEPTKPTEKNNPNAGVDPLFKTVIKSGPSAPAASSATAEAAAPSPPPPVDTRQIWSAAEAQAATELEEEDSGADGRRKPDYEFLYAQSLDASDAFLGLSGADPLSASCQGLIVRVMLPGAKAAELQLDLTPNRMRVRSNKYNLFLHLPHTVDDARGRAKWDGKKESLSVTLPIVRREEDIM